MDFSLGLPPHNVRNWRSFSLELSQVISAKRRYLCTYVLGSHTKKHELSKLIADTGITHLIDLAELNGAPKKRAKKYLGVAKNHLKF